MTKSFNFPSLPLAQIVPELIESIVPVLAETIHDAAAEIAERECGDSATIFDVERIAGELLYALADLLTLSPVPLRGVSDLLRFHQLDAVHAAAYFDYDIAPALAVVGDNGGEHASDHYAEGEDDDETQEADAPKAIHDRGVVQFADLASAARALNLPAEQIAALGGAGERQPCKNPECHETFIPSQVNQRFHSEQCRNSYWNKHRRPSEQKARAR